MRTKPTVAFFASSLLSAYWNGAATYYRGIVRSLHERGFRVTFYEPDIFDRQKHRDIDVPEWAEVVVYQANIAEDIERAVAMARGADIIVKASGVGAFDELLEEVILQHRDNGSIVIFWDVDAPATLDRLDQNPADPFHELLPKYDFIFTYGGGDKVVNAYTARGARACVPIYNALDPITHYPVPPDQKFAADISFLGNRLPDREARVEEFFLRAAQLCPGKSFLLGGSGWNEKPIPSNVTYLGHVFTHQHNAFNCTPLTVLNISRDSMAAYGFSPATRVFEATGAGACLITDRWEGVEAFFEPDKEILVAGNAEDVAMHLEGLNPARAKAIGDAALKKVLARHTYAQRAELVEKVLQHGVPAATEVLA